MLSLNPGIRYWLYQAPASMGKSFDGLSGIATNEMKAPLLSGDVFIFLNRRRTHIKMLQWQLDGFGIYYKRLEQGTFERPQPDREGASVIITPQQLELILQGVSLKKVHYRKRYILSKRA
jgi:transposase